MKKKLYIFIVIIMAFSVYFANKSLDITDSLFEANIEALADSEANLSDGSWLMVYTHDYGGFLCCDKKTGWCTSSWLPCNDYY